MKGGIEKRVAHQQKKILTSISYILGQTYIYIQVVGTANCIHLLPTLCILHLVEIEKKQDIVRSIVEHGSYYQGPPPFCWPRNSRSSMRCPWREHVERLDFEVKKKK